MRGTVERTISTAQSDRRAGVTPTFVLPSQVFETRLALLPQTLGALSKKGVITRKTLPIVYPPRQDEKAYAHWMAFAYGSADIQPTVLHEIDEVTRLEGRSILLATPTQGEKKEIIDPKVWDVITIGTGWGGVVTTARIRTLLPDSEIVMLDNRHQRGGQCRDNGFDYTFNSPAEGENSGLPGEMNGPNNLGPDVLLQIGELTNDPFPKKSVAGETFAINGFFEGPAITNTDATEIFITQDPAKPYKVTFIDNETGETKYMYSKAVALVTGQGRSKWGFDIHQPETKSALEEYSDRIFLTDEFREYLPSLATQDILKMVSEGLSFGGGRDGTNTAIRYLISRLREELSDDQIQALSVDVYGAHYNSAEDFSEVMGTHVYDDLLPFVGTLIKPKPEKIVGLLNSASSLGLQLDTDTTAATGTFCASAGYSDDQLQNMLQTIEGGLQSPVIEDVLGVGELEGQIIARKVAGEEIYVLGVAAREKKPNRKGKSLRTFGRAIRKHAPRVLQAADVISEALVNNAYTGLAVEPVLYTNGRDAKPEYKRESQTAHPQTVILTGPNGVGKSTISNLLLQDLSLPLTPFVRHTSRPQGPTEINDFDYHFVTQGTFNAMEDDGRFLHTIRKPFGSYGESREELQRAMKGERIVLFQLALDSALGLQRALNRQGISSVTIFVSPIDLVSGHVQEGVDHLRRRMEERGRGENPEELALRLDSAREWLTTPPVNVHHVINADREVEAAIQQIYELFTVARIGV